MSDDSDTASHHSDSGSDSDSDSDTDQPDSATEQEEDSDSDQIIVPNAVPPTLNNNIPTPQPPPRPPVPDIEAQLFEFMCDHQITHASMRHLLRILNCHAGTTLKPVVRDPRTLMKKFRRKDVNVTINGEVAYVGIVNALTCIYAEKKPRFEEPRSIRLAFNCDGLQTSKSSQAEVWPVLMSTDICPESVSVVAVFYGKEKPSAHILLNNCVKELSLLLRNGYTFGDGVHKDIILDYIVCDLPAMSLVKCIKAPTAYSSCSKCDVVGVRADYRQAFSATQQNAAYASRCQKIRLQSKRKTFPADGEVPEEVPGPTQPVSLRTNESFRTKLDSAHHTDGESPFLALLSIDMIGSFTIDGMHTIYLGAVKRFLAFLRGRTKKKRKKSRRPGTLSDQHFDNIGKLFGSASKFPREFARKPRNFDHYDKWKATELRTFLLYGGDLALRGTEAVGTGVPEVVVSAFRYLSTAIRILSDLDLYLVFWHAFTNV